MSAESASAFGELLRRYRAAAGLTQEELAARSGISPQGIGLLERGERQRPQAYTVHTLAAVLGLGEEDRARLVAAARGRKSASSPAALTAQDAQRPPFVGRVRELALLDDHLRRRGPPVLLLAGEPGIGKSRLLSTAADRAPALGWTVLAGGCQRRAGQEPYAPLLEALQRHLQALPQAQVRPALRGCAWLVRLLPELAAGLIEGLPAWTLTPDQERRLMFEAVGRFLANVAGPSGTLLVLDDLQWAGSDALDLLATLLRAASTASVRVVGAYRDTEAPPEAPLAGMLADLAQAGLAAHHTLAPLTAPEVGQLLDGLLEPGADSDSERDGELRERVVRRTGGVPFFVLSCAQALRVGQGAEGATEAVPWDVAQSVRQRVAALPEAARGVLGVAAVIGRSTTPALLVAVTARTDDEVCDALEAAGRLRLLEEDGQGYHFAHDLVREVVEADLSAARRQALHRRVAEVLESAPEEPPVELLAYHFSRSGVQDKAVLYLEQAGDRALAQHANAAAESYYRELVDCLDRLGRAHEATRVREKLGTVLHLMARYAMALTVLEQAAEAHRVHGDLESLARVTAQIGHVYAERGTAHEGIERVQSLLERLEGGGASHGLVALYLALVDLCMRGGRYSEGAAAAKRAADLARAVGHNSMLIEAEWQRGIMLDFLGQTAEAIRVSESVIPLAEAVGELGALSRTLNILAHICVHQGDFDRSRQYIERALATAERRGDPAIVAFCTMHRGFIAFCSGQWRQARADGEQALALTGQIGMCTGAAHPPMVLGFVAYGEGRWVEAIQYLEQSVELVQRGADIEALRMAQSVLAELDLRGGHPEVALERLAPLLDHDGLKAKDSTFLLPKVAWAHLELGDVVHAAEVADQAVTHTRCMDDRLNLVEALRVQALVANQQERWEDAAPILEEALSLAQGMCYYWGEARVLTTYGEMAAQREEMEPARERLGAALAIFSQLGARKDVEGVERAISKLPSV